MPDPRLLQVDADLSCEFNGNRIRIRSQRDRKLVCEFPNSKALFAMRKMGGKSKWLRELGRRLRLAEQTVDVLVGGELVARFGRDANGGLLRLVGVSSTELRLRKIAVLLLTG